MLAWGETSADGSTMAVGCMGMYSRNSGAGWFFAHFKKKWPTVIPVD
jgi:hypothetical protein